MKTFKDIEEVNSAGYLTVEQANTRLISLKSSLRISYQVNGSYEFSFFKTLGSISYRDKPYVIMPECKKKLVYAIPEEVFINNLDIQEAIFVFRESDIDKLGFTYLLKDAPEGTRFILS
jgi:hypothetical protein